MEQLIGEQVALVEVHRPAHGIMDAVTVVAGAEMPRPIIQVFATKRVSAVHSVPRPRQGLRADINGIDVAPFDGEAGVQ